MIAIDIDDTLVNDKLEVSAATGKALLDAVQSGVIVTLATGRMFASAQNIAKQLQLNVPIITYQGALVKNTFDQSVLYERHVPQAVIDQVYRYTKQHGLYLQVYWQDALYVQEDGEKIKAYAKQSAIPYTIEPDFDRFARLPLTKLLMIDEPQRLDEVKIELNERLGSQAHVTKSKAHYLEVLHPEATKGHALRHLAAHFGCGMNEVIAIGDSWNDREMIEAAGLGVAMGNALPALKEIADYITKSNNEDGVKQVIDEFILRPRRRISVKDEAKS